MTPTHYVILAYVIGLGLLLGYAAMIALGLRRARRRGHAPSGKPGATP